jgi:hypothetical protein
VSESSPDTVGPVSLFVLLMVNPVGFGSPGSRATIRYSYETRTERARVSYMQLTLPHCFEKRAPSYSSELCNDTGPLGRAITELTPSCSWWDVVRSRESREVKRALIAYSICTTQNRDNLYGDNNALA